MKGFLPCAILAVFVLVHSSWAVYVQEGLYEKDLWVYVTKPTRVTCEKVKEELSWVQRNNNRQIDDWRRLYQVFQSPQHLIFPVHRLTFHVTWKQDGDLKFPLESVKKLKELMDAKSPVNPRMLVPMATYSPCHEKSLPEEFQPVCKREDAPKIFQRLSLAAGDDLCEICANAACAGCF